MNRLVLVAVGVMATLAGALVIRIRRKSAVIDLPDFRQPRSRRALNLTSQRHIQPEGIQLDSEDEDSLRLSR